MEFENIKELQKKIIEALKISSEKLIETKRKNKQKIVIWQNGKIVTIHP